MNQLSIFHELITYLLTEINYLNFFFILDIISLLFYFYFYFNFHHISARNPYPKTISLIKRFRL